MRGLVKCALQDVTRDTEYLDLVPVYICSRALKKRGSVHFIHSNLIDTPVRLMMCAFTSPLHLAAASQQTIMVLLSSWQSNIYWGLSFYPRPLQSVGLQMDIFFSFLTPVTGVSLRYRKVCVVYIRYRKCCQSVQSVREVLKNKKHTFWWI